MEKSVVISARVPVDVAQMIKNGAKTQGISPSKYISNFVTYTPQKLNKGGNIAIVNHELPEEIKQVLSAVGGLGIGILVYNVLKNYLPTDTMDKETRENVALLGSVAGGLVGLLALDSLLNKK